MAGVLQAIFFLYCRFHFVCIVLFDFIGFTFKIGLMNGKRYFRECCVDGGVVEDEGVKPKTPYVLS